MPIASSGAISIGSAAGSGRSINVEVGRTQNTANTSMTDVVTAAVTGSTPRGSGTVTQAQPHAFSEWHSYTHTQDFGAPTYYVRTGTGTADVCVEIIHQIIADEPTGSANTIFYFKLNGTVVEFYMKPDHTNRYEPTVPNQITSLSEYASYWNVAGEQQVNGFTGNFSSGFTPLKIAQLDVGSVSGLQARISATVIDGTGTYVPAVTGYTIGDGGTYDTGWRTPHSSTLYGISPQGLTMPQGCFSYQLREPYHRMTMQIKATGYNTKTLNNFVSVHDVTASSDGCV